MATFSKTQLKQIIKEELNAVINETSDEELEHDIENTKQISQAVVDAIMDQQLRMGLDFKDRDTINLIFNALDSAGATMRGMHKGGSAMQEGVNDVPTADPDRNIPLPIKAISAAHKAYDELAELLGDNPEAQKKLKQLNDSFFRDEVLKAQGLFEPEGGYFGDR